MPAIEVDARGLKCPLPVLKVETKLAHMSAGTILHVIADDPVAAVDIPLYCKNNGFDCTTTRDGSALKFSISKPGP